MKQLTKYTETLEVGDILPRGYGSFAGRGLGENSTEWLYKVTFVSQKGSYEAVRILPSGKPSKRVVYGIWSNENSPNPYVPGGVSAWGNK